MPFILFLYRHWPVTVFVGNFWSVVGNFRGVIGKFWSAVGNCYRWMGTESWVKIRKWHENLRKVVYLIEIKYVKQCFILLNESEIRPLNFFFLLLRCKEMKCCRKNSCLSKCLSEILPALPPCANCLAGSLVTWDERFEETCFCLNKQWDLRQLHKKHRQSGQRALGLQPCIV